MDKLTAKQRLFVTEYLKDLNATQSAIRAGYAKDSAEVQASRLLSNAKVKQAIESRLNARVSRLERCADEVLRDITDIAKTAKNAFMGNPENTAVASIALKALELEGKHYSLFERQTINEDEAIEPREIVFQVLPAAGETRVTIGKNKDHE